jgi:uncharacterized protein (TIGR03437 family)
MQLGWAVLFLTLAAPSAAFADSSGTAALAPNTFLNLDTGVVSNEGGDLLWDGLALTPQGRAGLFNLGKYGSRVFKSIRASNASSVSYGAAPIPAGRLVAGDVFGVHTNGGHYAKLLVTANDGSLTLQYTLFLKSTLPATTASSAPAITVVQNNYSYIVPKLPNYGIAPGSIFVIVGTGLSAAIPPVLQSSAAPGLPTKLNQTSVSVTINGVTTTPALYYTSAGQLAAVLPSTTPVGNGTISVNYNGQTVSGPMTVVASAVGLDTLYGTGNGAGVATDLSGNLIGLSNSAMPGQTITMWGSGLGADPNNDDRTYPQNLDNLTNIPMQIYIGGISANILYRGRSQFPGLDQYNLVIPAGVSPGCYVSAVIQTGNVVSNAVTLAVSPNGGPCSDPASGLSGAQIKALAAKAGGSANVLTAAINQVTEGSGTSISGIALAGAMVDANFGNGYEYASQGSCTFVPPAQGSLFNQFSSTLDAGAIQVSGPAGQVFNLASQGPGFYQGQLPGTTAPPGTYTFTGSGGANIGSFKSSVNLGTPLALTNQNALATITRANGATVSWSGGFAGGDVQIEGAVGGSFGSVRFYCHAPNGAGQFAIPPAIMLGMPAGGGSLYVTNTTAAQTITASGLDVGLAIGTAVIKLDVNFK